ncbi:MAG: hypothetical protein K0B06_04800 [Brevefilum sp.]|nr:hypothetical protein [Brevefilum sp.]
MPAVTPIEPFAGYSGTLLLIQTGYDEYHYLDPKNQISVPIDLPITDPQFRLGANLSPSGTQLFILQEDRTALIFDLMTNKVSDVYDFNSPTLFTPEIAITAARQYLNEEDFTDAYLLELIHQAYQASKGIIRWYQSDHYHLSVHDTDEISTHLFLDDHQRGERTQLEDQPGLVKDFRTGPGGNQILLKKGFVFLPGEWRDDQYYLLDLNQQSIQPIPLPTGVINPAVTWFDQRSLQIIHQVEFIGGKHLSLIDTATMAETQIIQGEFSDLRRFGEGLLVFQRDSSVHLTTIKILNSLGESKSTKEIQDTCYYQTSLGSDIILNCETDSLLLDQDLNIRPLGDRISIFSPSPDLNSIITTDQNERVGLLDGELNWQGELHLEGTPLEIRWLPDSSGFLYRPRGELLYYDLASAESYLLHKSDIFSDYTNINAIWVDFD